MTIKTIAIAYTPATLFWVGGVWAACRSANALLVGLLAIGIIASTFWATYILTTMEGE